MNPDRDDEKLEAYLKQFQARAPRPLPARRRPVTFRRTAAFTAAAAVILVALTLFLLKRPERRRPRVVLVPHSQPIAEQISLIRLSRLAQQDPEKLGSDLDRLSWTLLPDVQTSKGVLKQLARE